MSGFEVKIRPERGRHTRLGFLKLVTSGSSGSGPAPVQSAPERPPLTRKTTSLLLVFLHRFTSYRNNGSGDLYSREPYLLSGQILSAFGCPEALRRSCGGVCSMAGCEPDAKTRWSYILSAQPLLKCCGTPRAGGVVPTARSPATVRDHFGLRRRTAPEKTRTA